MHYNNETTGFKITFEISHSNKEDVILNEGKGKGIYLEIYFNLSQ